MSIELNDEENLFGDTIAAAPDIDRDVLSRALYAVLKSITLEEFVTMFTNPFEAVVDYANLCAGEKTGQRISLNFNPHRLDTGTKRFPISLYAALKDDRFVNGLARVVLLNRKKGNTKELLYASVGMGVQGTSYVQEFPPHVARDLAKLYGMSSRCSVLDPCAGWGGRMLGFSAIVNRYTACEPSTRTAEGLRRILAFIKSFRAEFDAQLYEAPFEDVELTAASFDFAFTSPPYYDTERYAIGEATNSFNRYASFSDWCAGFYAPLIHRTMRALKPGACFVINIGSRLYPLNDKLLEISQGKYEVSKEKDRLSASNGLGKTGEGETFYEVKNPGEWVEPDTMPIVINNFVPNSSLTLDAAVAKGQADLAAAVVVAFNPLNEFLSSVTDELQTSAVEPETVKILTVEQSAAPAAVVVSESQSAAHAAQDDAGSDFNPLDAFLTDVGPYPAGALPDTSEDNDAVYEESVKTTLAPVALSAHDVQQFFADRNVQLYERHGKLVITNAATLSDDDRELLKTYKAELLIIVPPFSDGDSVRASMLTTFLGEAPNVAAPADWKLESPPSLDGIDVVEFDFETNGLKWYAGDRPIGFSLRLPNGNKKYYPFAHQNAQQLDEAQCKEWMRRELRGKRIRNANTRFDIHMAREWGVDLVEQHNTFTDVMHYAALLDDHRRKFALNELSKDYLGVEKHGMDLDPTRMATYEPWVVAARAEGDVEAVAQLCDKLIPLMQAEELMQVSALEDAIIPVVCEMEKNGAPIDMELLARWTKETEHEYYECIKAVSHEAGFNFDDSDAAWTRLFEKYHLPLTFKKQKNSDEYSDKPTFKDSILARIDHPVIAKARYAAQLDSLRSKIFKPYSEIIGADGLLRAEYNQLRTDDENSGERGTVSGRFSAAYVQQVPNHDNHFDVFGAKYYPRQLYVPGSGLFFAGDAAQIEYRIFASHAKNKAVLEAYAKDPMMSFHKFMWPKITAYRPDFNYSSMKSFNFMRIYGGGTVKTAQMMGMITEAQADEIQRTKTQRTSPLLAKAREIEEIYAREMPEAGPLTKKAMHLAMTEHNNYCNHNDEMHKAKIKHRGFVKTVLGRRSRFPTEYKIYKALNAIIQGSAADIMKTKLVELFKARKELGFTMRATVHDEVFGDIPDIEAEKKIAVLLNQQSIPFAVPILWSTGTGKSWADAK